MNLNISSISTRRTEIMGLSIFMVMMFHTVLHINNQWFSYIFKNGDLGVEMFAYVSGIGIVNSLKKHTNLKDYYIRRLIRILPAFYIAAIPVAIYRHHAYGATYGQMLTLLSTMSIFRDVIDYWYISYILLCYLFAPLLFRIIKNIRIPLLFTLLGFTFTLCVYWITKHIGLYSEVWVFRIPIFFLGMECSELCCRKSKTNNQTKVSPLFYLALFIGIYFIVVQYTDSVEPPIRYTNYFFITPICIWALANFFNKTSWVQFVFSHIGKYTLELYLVHQWICLPIAFANINNSYIAAISAVLLAYVLARLVSYLSKHVITALLNPKHCLNQNQTQ